jgi:hypothetical protein
MKLFWEFIKKLVFPWFITLGGAFPLLLWILTSLWKGSWEFDWITFILSLVAAYIIVVSGFAWRTFKEKDKSELLVYISQKLTDAEDISEGMSSKEKSRRGISSEEMIVYGKLARCFWDELKQNIPSQYRPILYKNHGDYSLTWDYDVFKLHNHYKKNLYKLHDMLIKD